MDTTVNRFWDIGCGPYSNNRRALADERPTMNDALFIRLLCRAAADKKEFDKTIRTNAALVEWASEIGDQELRYLFWLGRPLR